MVCCALIAAILGFFTLLIRPFFKSTSPLAWQLGQEDMMDTARFTLSARLASFGFAFAGLKFVFSHEHNMRIHLFTAIFVIAGGVLWRLNAEQWRWIALAITLVLVSEALNTAVEQACNALGGKHNQHIGIAKDVAAGAVLMACGFAIIIGLSVFVPQLLEVRMVEAPDFSKLSMCISAN
jgi:diacylglycerol kinase